MTKRTLAIASLVCALLGSAVPTGAGALQSLVPLPYPGAVSSGQPLDPEPQEFGGPQTIMKDPYPRILGDNAQGNPPISRAHHHQHLEPSIYQRKYRAERHGS